MSQKESVEKIKNDDSDVIEYGEFQSPKLTRKPTMFMPSAPPKTAFKRKIRLDEIDDDSFKKLQEEVDGVWEKHGIIIDDSEYENDDDLFDDDIKTPLSDIDEEVKIHNSDTEHDGEIIEVGKKNKIHLVLDIVSHIIIQNAVVKNSKNILKIKVKLH